MAAVTAIVAGAGALVSTGVGIYQSSKANSMAEANMETQQGQVALARIDQKTQQAKMDKQKEAYRNVEFKNPYADMKNPYAENVFEDITVNQQQAQFQAEKGAQSRANIMQGMQGAAGGSGIASLAQAMANQGQLQTQQISASIGQQESMNQKLRAQGAQRVQTGAATVDLQQRQGEDTLQQREMSRQSTLLGMEMGELSGARSATQGALANQMAADSAAVQAKSGQASAWLGMANSLGGMAGAGIGGGGTPKDTTTP